MVKILDCTTRDGGHETKWNFEDVFVKTLMEFVNKSNVSYYEIGYRNHVDIEGKGSFYTCSPEFLKPFYEVKGDLQLGVMTDYKRYNANDFPNKSNDFIDFVRIACHPDKIAESLKVAEDLHKKGYKIFIQLMEIQNVGADGYIELFQWKNKNILESLYFADSYSALKPEDIEKYYNKLKTIGYEKLSFHAHNELGLALENSLRAAELGCYTIDTTFNGIGRGGGNLKLQELLENLPC